MFDFPLALARHRYLVLLVECSRYPTDYLGTSSSPGLVIFSTLTINSNPSGVFAVFLDVFQVPHANDILAPFVHAVSTPRFKTLYLGPSIFTRPGQSMPTSQLVHQYG